MAKVSVFKPKAELDAEANLRNFIEFARNELTVFGADLEFDANIWDISARSSLKARNTTASLHFTGYPSSSSAKDGRAMPEPFNSFAKAYIRNLYSFSDAKVSGELLTALRALLLALEEAEVHTSPTQATVHHFQRASVILNSRLKSPHTPNKALEKISEFITENHLVAIPVAWRTATSKPQSTTSRVGPEFDARRQARLPSPDALGAIAEIFHVATAPADVAVTSICALLTSAPNRANEVLHLPVDCEVSMLDASGTQVYGLRWRPSKNGDAGVKWVVSAMTDVAKAAVTKLRNLSEEARIVARWYEENPGKLYLPPHLEHLRAKPRLTNRDVSAILFRDLQKKVKPEQQGSKWCGNQGISSRWEGGSPAQGGCNTVAFEDVENAVVAMLPRGFPIANPETGLRYSEALCIALVNETHAVLSTYRCAFTLIDYSMLNSRLVGRRTVKSIFDKFGYKDGHGKPLYLTSHQFRHYLNTLAQMGGLSQFDIAKWSGRAKVAQNAVYDHESDRDVLAKVRAAIGDENKMFGPLAYTPKNTLITRDQFATLRVLTAHTTDFGYCVHDFTMLPCQTHRDCLNCDEQVCIKGDEVREKAIRMCQKETRALLVNAKEAVEDGEFVANRWVAHQSMTLKRLDQLCAILDDPTVPVGAIIQPTGVVPASRLEQAAQHRALHTEAPQLRAPTSNEYESS